MRSASSTALTSQSMAFMTTPATSPPTTTFCVLMAMLSSVLKWMQMGLHARECLCPWQRRQEEISATAKTRPLKSCHAPRNVACSRSTTGNSQRSRSDMPAVGNSVARKDGIGKATGSARYADDLTFPGMLHGRTIRSTIPRGRIRSIRLDFDPSGFTVVDYRDVPGRNVVDLIEQDQPFLVERDVRHMAEPILLLAHEDKERLEAARVEIEYDEAEPVFDPERSDGILKAIDIVKGDVDAAMASADVVVEGTYRTGHQEHVYIEPNGVIAVPEEGGMALYGSLQCPFYAIKALKCLLGAHANIRVVQTETGGGFGGKEEFPSVIAGHAVLLALKSGRPVKIIYDRVEDMIATTKRHPSVVRHRTGVKRDGTLVAMDVDVILDGGAYVTLSPVVISRGSIHAAGAYRCENTRIRGRAMFTNTPPNGAFRGFGAPQTLFAVEAHMERVANELGMDS